MNIMLNDLKPEKQAEILKFLGLKSPEEGCYEAVPLFIITDIQTINNSDQNSYDRVVITLLATGQK